MEVKPENVRNVEETIAEAEKQFSDWMEDSQNPTEKASLLLAKLLTPGWYRFLKESGAKNSDVLQACVRAFSAIICEAIGNVSDEPNRTKLAEIVSLQLAATIMAGAKRLKDTPPEGLYGMRKTDS